MHAPTVPSPTPSRLRRRSLLVASALLLGACGPAPDRSDPNPLGLLGTVPFTPLEKVAFTLTDTRGEAYDFRAETDGKIALLFFGYTFCPDICPVHMATLSAALRELDPEVRERVVTVFVSVDPARDAPERLQGWLQAFDSSFVGVTGTDEELTRALAFYRYPPTQFSGEGVAYTVSHPAMIYAFTPDNLGRAMYGSETPKAVWVHDLNRMAGHDWSGGSEALATPPGAILAAETGGIRVYDAVVPRPPTATTTAFYFTLHNGGAEPDTLTGLATGSAAQAMIHDMVTEGGVMRMVHLHGGVALPPGATVRFQPGGLHGMLVGLTGLPEPGGSVEIVLRFARAGEVAVAARVVRYEDVGR